MENQRQNELEDIIYFANLYQKLSSHSMHDVYNEGYEVFDHMDFITNVVKFNTILQNIHDKPREKAPDKAQMQNLVSLFIDAQVSLSYLLKIGCPADAFQNHLFFLKSSREKVKHWNSLSSASCGTFQTSPKTSISFRQADNLNGLLIEHLGTNSSLFYDNDEEDSNDESAEDEDDTEEDSDG